MGVSSGDIYVCIAKFPGNEVEVKNACALGVRWILRGRGVMTEVTKSRRWENAFSV
jgi:hypothetical protein